MPIPFEIRFARRLAPIGMGFALAVSCLQAWSQSGFNGDVMKNYGGNYAIACQDAGSPRLRVTPTSLVFTQGGKSITGRDMQAAYSYFGNSPPANYRVALMSQVKGNTSMVFIVYEDKQGQYITLDADDKLAAALGKARVSARYRYCDGPRAEAVGKPLALPPQASKPAGPAAAVPQYGFDLFQNPQFKALYIKTAGPLTRERWLAKLEGPTGPLRKTAIGGAEFVVADNCKPHDCYDHNVLVFYASARGLLYARVFQKGKVTLVGSPPPAVVAELDRLWLATFRRK